MPKRDDPIVRELDELVTFMQIHNLHSIDDSVSWAKAMRKAIIADPLVLDSLANWVHYAMKAGYEVGYKAGCEDCY